MKKFSDRQPDFLREKLIGLGENSIRKNYYPELQKRLAELETFRKLLDKVNDGILFVTVISIGKRERLEAYRQALRRMPSEE